MAGQNTCANRSSLFIYFTVRSLLSSWQHKFECTLLIYGLAFGKTWGLFLGYKGKMIPAHYSNVIFGLILGRFCIEGLA